MTFHVQYKSDQKDILLEMTFIFGIAKFWKSLQNFVNVDGCAKTMQRARR